VQSLTLVNDLGVSKNWNFNTLQQPSQLQATLGSSAPMMTLGWGYNSGADWAKGTAKGTDAFSCHHDPIRRHESPNRGHRGGWFHYSNRLPE